MAETRVTMHGEVVGLFLRGEVGTLPRDLERRARNVQRAAGAAYKMEGHRGQHRYRTTVRSVGRVSDPRTTLTQALDAARAE